jgi:hypothetical protein
VAQTAGRDAGPAAARQVFLGVLAAGLALRLALSFVVPFTGDEAYYFFWGVYPDYGGYDHPAMVGWWLTPLVQLGNAPWLIRLPAVLLLAPVAWLCFELARPAGRVPAYLAGAALMLVPVQLFDILTTTDTPLVLFCLASLLAYQRAILRVHSGGGAVNRFHLYAGLLLGAALLSKYFAALLAVAYFTHAVFAPRRERVWPGLLVVGLTALPLFLVNILWNYEHCWLNVLFNFYTRHDNVGLSVRDVATYGVVLLYTTSPLLLWQLARSRAARARPADPARRIVLHAFIVPLALFGLLSLVKTIGLHWVFAFTPLAFVLAAWDLDERRLRQNLRLLAGFSALHFLAVALVLALPLETWKRSHLYDGLVLTVEPEAILRVLAPYAKDYVFATDVGSNSVTLSYARRRAEHPGPLPAGQAADSATNGDFLVFGEGSAHGRQQDRFDDFRVLAGRNILVFRKTVPEPRDYEPYFDRVEMRTTVLHGVTYHLVLGQGFRYADYRDRVLAHIRDKFYALPAWLPAGHCFFCERYFGAPNCPHRALEPSPHHPDAALRRGSASLQTCA